MKAINGLSLNTFALDPGSTKRLHDKMSNLKRESTGRLFQSEAIEVLRTYLEYERDRRYLDETVDYLYNLKDVEGRPYCKSYKRYSDLEGMWDSFLQPERDSFMWNRHARRALEIVKKRYASSHLCMATPKTDKDVTELIADWDTSPGYEGIINPKYCNVNGKRRCVKRAYVDGISDELERRCEEAKAQGTFGDIIVPGTRSQASGAFEKDGSFTGTCKMKTRIINMVSLYHVLAEAKFGRPLSDWLIDYPYSNIGWDSLQTNRWVNKQRMNGRPFISLDYSKYDTTIPSWLIHSAFDVIRAAFDQYDEQLLKVIEHDFIHKYMLTGDGVIHVHHGNPSGSALTAIINGICNEIITETWLSHFGLTAEYNIMGDDNCIYLVMSETTPLESLLSQIASYITHNFGIAVNPQKCNYGTSHDDPEYLSRWWTNSGAYRPLGEVIAMLGYGERRRDFDGTDENGHRILTPEQLIYAMVLTYPATMNRYMDVRRFIIENNLDDRYFFSSSALRREIPYALRMRYESIKAKNATYFKPRTRVG